MTEHEADKRLRKAVQQAYVTAVSTRNSAVQSLLAQVLWDGRYVSDKQPDPSFEAFEEFLYEMAQDQLQAEHERAMDEIYG